MKQNLKYRLRKRIGQIWVKRKVVQETDNKRNSTERQLNSTVQSYPPSTELGLHDPSVWKPNWLSPLSSLVLRDRDCELFTDNTTAVVVGTSSSLSCMLEAAELQDIA